jgi:hypothetical protein
MSTYLLHKGFTFTIFHSQRLDELGIEGIICPELESIALDKKNYFDYLRMDKSETDEITRMFEQLKRVSLQEYWELQGKLEG